MVTGGYACGKGTLLSLLEGHKDILAIAQWHDMLIDTFYNFESLLKKYGKSFRGKDDRIILLRRSLSCQDYPMLEQYSIQKKIAFPISVDKYEFLDYNLDFYNQQKDFFEAVYNLDNKNLTMPILLNLFVKTYIKNYKGINIQNPKYFVSASDPGFYQFKELIANYPEIKIIYIKRNWLIPYVTRLEKLFRNTGENILNMFFTDPRLTGIIEAEHSCNEISKTYPNNFKIIEFKDLIENSAKIIKEVAQFLELEWSDILLRPTYMGKELTSQKIIGKVLDTEENSSLSKFKIIQIKEAYRNRCEYILKENFSASEDYYTIRDTRILDFNIKDISVIVMGIIDKKRTSKCLNSIRKHLPQAQIILSTFENQDISGLNYDKIVFNPDPGIGDLSLINQSPDETNRQIILLKNALKNADGNYILKVPSDAKITSINFIKYYKKFNKQISKRQDFYSIFKQRVMISSYFTRNPENSIDLMGYCFCPSLLWMFGLKEDLENLLDIPFEEKYLVKINGKLFRFRTTEQYIWLSFLEKYNQGVFMDSMYYNEPCIKNLSLKSIINNFFILDNDISGISLSLKKNNLTISDYKYIFYTKRYLKLYKKYCDNNYHISKYLNILFKFIYLKQCIPTIFTKKLYGIK